MSDPLKKLHILRLALPLAMLGAVSACGDKDEEANLASLDAQLTNNAADPALRGAVEGNISVDPDLVGQSNRNSVRPSDRPASGAVPAGAGRQAARAEAEKLAGGELMEAPASSGEANGAMAAASTLGARAAAQQSGGKCTPAKVQYDNGWAQRLPGAFPIYPGGSLIDAAGKDDGGCSLVAVSFTTPATDSEIMSFYYTMARRNGYSGERARYKGQDVLGGTQGDSAYIVMLEPVPGGGQKVDLILSGDM